MGCSGGTIDFNAATSCNSATSARESGNGKEKDEGEGEREDFRCQENQEEEENWQLGFKIDAGGKEGETRGEDKTHRRYVNGKRVKNDENPDRLGEDKEALDCEFDESGCRGEVFSTMLRVSFVTPEMPDAISPVEALNDISTNLSIRQDRLPLVVSQALLHGIIVGSPTSVILVSSFLFLIAFVFNFLKNLI